jgi:predicted PurR-regulated permease PerM
VIILALFVGTVFHPLYQWMRIRLGRRESLAALVCVLLVFLLLIVPIVSLTGVLARQAIQFAEAAQVWVNDGGFERALESSVVERLTSHPRVAVLWEQIQERVRLFDPGQLDVSKGLLSVSDKALNVARKGVLPVLSKTGSLLFGFFLMLFLLFYVFRDGERALARLLHISPLTSSQEQAVLERIRVVARATVLGNLGTALAQGFAAMIGFAFVGIPALFWGTMLAAASLVPVVGTSLVWVPACLYLLITGHVAKAVILTVWCILVVGAIDNFLRPVLMKGSTGMSSLILFLAILGGLQAFGLVGLLYGPLIFGLCAVCLSLYEIENSRYLKTLDQL